MYWSSHRLSNVASCLPLPQQVNHHDDSEISGYDDNDEVSQKTTLTTDEVDDGDSRSNEDERSLPELINTPPR